MSSLFKDKETQYKALPDCLFYAEFDCQFFFN